MNNQEFKNYFLFKIIIKIRARFKNINSFNKNMKKSVIISIVILLLLVGLFLMATNIITKYTGFVTGNMIKENISKENCEQVKTNKIENTLNNSCNGG